MHVFYHQFLNISFQFCNIFLHVFYYQFFNVSFLRGNLIILTYMSASCFDISYSNTQQANNKWDIEALKLTDVNRNTNKKTTSKNWSLSRILFLGMKFYYILLKYKLNKPIYISDHKSTWKRKKISINNYLVVLRIPKLERKKNYQSQYLIL